MAETEVCYDDQHRKVSSTSILMLKSELFQQNRGFFSNYCYDPMYLFIYKS